MAFVHINPYKSSYLAAKQELEQRRAELEFVHQRIAQLEQTINTLEPLANEHGAAPTLGLTELCRQILLAHPGTGFSVGQFMQYLTQMGVDISGYANPGAVLHTVLTRIAKPGSGFVKGVGPDNQPVYGYDEKHRSVFRFPRFGRK